MMYELFLWTYSFLWPHWANGSNGQTAWLIRFYQRVLLSYQFDFDLIFKKFKTWIK